MSNFIDYEASYITPQGTLLKKFNEVLKFLRENDAINGKTELGDIFDENNNKRFISGDITTAGEGIEIKYGKWALSGFHLIIVAVISGTSGSVSNKELVSFELPQYVFDDLVTLFETNYVALETGKGLNHNIVGDTLGTVLVKNENSLSIQGVVNETITSGFEYRIEYDLVVI